MYVISNINYVMYIYIYICNIKYIYIVILDLDLERLTQFITSRLVRQ